MRRVRPIDHNLKTLASTRTIPNQSLRCTRQYVDTLSSGNRTDIDNSCFLLWRICRNRFGRFPVAILRQMQTRRIESGCDEIFADCISRNRYQICSCEESLLPTLGQALPNTPCLSEILIAKVQDQFRPRRLGHA